MSWLSNHYWEAGGVFAVGIAMGYWLVRWKERTLIASIRQGAEAQRQDLQRQAEGILREAREIGRAHV